MCERKEFQLVGDKAAINIVRLLKACAKQKDLPKGSKLHAYIGQHKFLAENSYVASTLVNMYARCGALAEAQEVLSKHPARGTVTWTALIAGYVQHGRGNEALKCFDSMQHEGCYPDGVTFTCAVKACASIGALAKGEEIHDQITSLGMLEKNVVLGSTLVDMYARCGVVAKAQKVLLELCVRNTVTWTALIAGYANQGQGKEALECFSDMQDEGHSPDAFAFTCALKACGIIGATVKGEQIHEKIANVGILDKNIMVGSALVDMYARCGLFSKAQKVLKELPIRDAVTWNGLIAGYVQHGQADEALKCFESMQCDGQFPDVVTFTCVLKACASIGAVINGERIHDHIVSLGMLEKNVVLGNILVDMYARCGALAKAQQVLEELSARSSVTWNALITGYVQQGQGEGALKCFDSMQCEGLSPDVITFTSILKACGSVRAFIRGAHIHDQIVSLDMLNKSIGLGSSLVDMYAKCGALAKAHQVLEQLHVRDMVTWTALITGYVHEGQGKEALECFNNMQFEGHFPDAVTFICALKSCASVGAATKGRQIHEKTAGMLEKNTVLGSALIEMYARCGALAKAQRVLEELPIRDVHTWNALIEGYAQLEQAEGALRCFDTMQWEGHSPDVVTFIYALKACGSVRAVARGKQIHYQIARFGILEKNTMLGSALVDMYARCGSLARAQQVLDNLPLSIRGVITWTALIAGYVQQGQGDEALKSFHSMQCEGHFPDAVTFTCALNACAITGATAKGEQIHKKIISLGMLERNVMLVNALVDMYARCGAFDKAQRMLKMLSVQDTITWNALIAGYAQQGQDVELLKFFETITQDGLSPDVFTFTWTLKSCRNMGAAAKGEQIHDMVVTLGMLKGNAVLASALMDMYAKCAELSKALEVLMELPVWDVVVWNTLIGGHAQHGQCEEALNSFESMQSKGITPNSATLVCMLHACSHSGLLHQATMCFVRMGTKYGIVPHVEHYGCMIDLFGRAGQIDKALEMIEKMPYADHLPIWLALLGACCKWGDVMIGRFAFGRSLCIDKSNVAGHICMANIYLGAGM